MNRRTFLAVLGTALAAPFVPKVPVQFKTRMWYTSPAVAEPLMFSGVPWFANDYVPRGSVFVIPRGPIDAWVEVGRIYVDHPRQFGMITNIGDPRA